MFEKIISKFLINKENDKNIIGGNIDYYNLTDWWLSAFTEEERKTIREKYKPFTVSSGNNKNEDFCIDKGLSKPAFGCPSQFEFLNGLCYCFAYEHEIAEKIFAKSEDCKNLDYIDKLNILDKHFYYSNQIGFHYPNRQKEEHLNLAIEYCKKQISISKKAKQAWFKEYPKDTQLPSHVGFKQLAIIYEKQKKYKEALDITKEALLEGWNNDNQKRIDRLEKKINKN